MDRLFTPPEGRPPRFRSLFKDHSHFFSLSDKYPVIATSNLPFFMSQCVPYLRKGSLRRFFFFSRPIAFSFLLYLAFVMSLYKYI